jgi:hypothetical protein
MVARPDNYLSDESEGNSIQRIIFLSRLRREIFQIFTNQTNFYCENIKDLTDLDLFVGFLPVRALLDIIR